MRSLFSLSALLALAGAFLLTGCTGDESKPAPAPAPAPAGAKPAGEKTAGEKPAPGVGAVTAPIEKATGAVAGAVAAATKLEIACAHCVYKKEGVTACAPAVKVGDKVLLLSAKNFDMFAADICKAPRQATVEGKIEGDKYVATRVDVVK